MGRDSALWVGILGVFAAPVALPIALALAAVVLALIITVLACVLSLLVTALAIIAAGIVGLILGVIVMFTAFADGLTTVGFALCALGLGLVYTYASFLLCRWSLRKLFGLLGRISKGGKKHENSH